MVKKKTGYQVVAVVGTRPELIKMMPVIKALGTYRSRVTMTLLSTDQHAGLLTSLFRTFKLQPRIRFRLMRFDQDLESLTNKALAKFHQVFTRFKPHLVLVQGDTTSALCGALVAYYHGVPVAHIEAGLRTHDNRNPFPEEINRRTIDAVSALHFAPTPDNKKNLQAEGIRSASIYVTGNTVIDAVKAIRNSKPLLPRKGLDRLLNKSKLPLLVTVHRREHIGCPLLRILTALDTIAGTYPEADIIFPVHPNPRIARPVRQRLGNRKNIHLVRPLDYPGFITVLQKVYLVLTDSGGIVEEAAYLGKPVLVLREKTERPEAVRSGAARLTGTQTRVIVNQVKTVLNSRSVCQKMSRARNPFGPGRAAEKTARVVMEKLPDLTNQ